MSHSSTSSASAGNKLSWFEKRVNAIATKAISNDIKGSVKASEKLLFGVLKKVSPLWYSRYTAKEKRNKQKDVVKRYIKRCDSLVKKVGFIFTVLSEPIKFVAVFGTIALCAAFIINASSYDVVLGVYTNGNLVGYLDSKSPMTTALTAIESDLSSVIGSEYTIDCDIDYSFINVKNPKLLNDADCYRTLYNIASSDFQDAYALYVDNVFVASSTDFDSLISVVNQITIDSEDGTVKNDIRISNQLCLKSSIKNAEEIASLLAVEISETEIMPEPSAEENITRVEVIDIPETSEKPDTLNTGIPRFTGGVNTLTLPHTLADGTKITTDKDELFNELDLVYVKNETVTEVIPYQTTYIESDDYYVGTQMLKNAGKEGSADVTYEIEYNKHGEISRTAVSKNVTKEAVAEVMVIGTSEIPTFNPSGNFIWPTDAPKGISSYYGGRQLFGNYDFHLGVDILNSYGNDIWAADSGVVTYAGYNNSYGYYVKIEHADGFSTLYAHMSKLYTEKGAEVKQGDVIGAIGKTGVATAYHLHFEIRIDGKTVNPLDYLPERKK